MVMKHQDDDGDLSIVAQGDNILVLCSKAHYWVIESTLTEPRQEHGQSLKRLAVPELGLLARDAMGL